MKHEDEPRMSDPEPASDEDSPALKTLLRRSLSSSAPEARTDDADTALLLASVQRKLRERSNGKFYADGWSTSRSSASYALVATVMLVTLALVYLALGPTGFGVQ